LRRRVAIGVERHLAGIERALHEVVIVEACQVDVVGIAVQHIQINCESSCLARADACAGSADRSVEVANLDDGRRTASDISGSRNDGERIVADRRILRLNGEAGGTR